MKEIVVSRAAQADIDELWVYHCGQSMATADRIVDAIGDQCDRLVEFPNLGRARRELHRDCRSLPIENYLLFYRVLSETIEIMRVIHSSRRITTLSELEEDVNN